MKEGLTFDQLPIAVCQLDRQLGNIERLLSQKSESSATEQPDQLLTVQQVAKILRLSVSTVYRKIISGELVSVKICGRKYVRLTDLIIYIRSEKCAKRSKVKQKSTLTFLRNSLRWIWRNREIFRWIALWLKTFFEG
jgi:excisionase family DNA binding protein